MAKVRLNSESLIKIAMVVLFLIYAWSAGTGADASDNGSQYQLVKVSRGDTVWSIAARTVGDKEDIRTVVVAIKKANSLDNNMQIQPGQVLKVPAKK
jgi:nucleoid-associated protein YgaU